jgi:F420-dependent oxidoreductase-like protein
MAQQALTTQAAVGGRLTLGIGLSHRPVVEKAWGLPFERPVELMREYLAVLRPLLESQQVAYFGKRYAVQAQLTIEGAAPPSVILAALGERMLRLAGEQTDGTATWMVGAKTLASHVTPVITAAARAAGRPAPRILVGLPTCVTDDVQTARTRAERIFGFYGQLPSYRAMLDREEASGPGDLALIGTEAEIEGRLGEIERAGATDFIASVFGSAEDQQHTFKLLRALTRSRVTHV